MFGSRAKQAVEITRHDPAASRHKAVTLVNRRNIITFTSDYIERLKKAKKKATEE